MTILLTAIMAGCGGGSTGATGAKGAAGATSATGATGAQGTSPARGPAPVLLGGAGNFVILTESGITDVVFASTITGNIGDSGTAAQMSQVSCAEMNSSLPAPSGKIYGFDAAYVGAGTCFVPTSPLITPAVTAMTNAYNDASTRFPDYALGGAGSIGSRDFVPATYSWTTAILIDGPVTLTGGPNDVWISQTTGAITQTAAMNVTLVADAGGVLPQAKNVFWQSGGVAHITAHMEGGDTGNSDHARQWRNGNGQTVVNE